MSANATATVLQLLFPQAPSTRASVGLFALRAFTGVTMMIHGWGKISNPFHWMDKSSSPAPAVFQALAALAEFGGGAALILGLVTTVAAFGIASTMVVAIATHVSKGDPFVGKGSWELAGVYLAICVALVGIGPGRLSLDDKFIRPKLP